MLPGFAGTNAVVVPTAAPQLSLLVVDDNRDFRESLVALRSRQGCSVGSATSCAAARAAIEERTLGAILADRELPDGVGIDLLSAGGDGMTELIVITGNATVASAV